MAKLNSEMYIVSIVVKFNEYAKFCKVEKTSQYFERLNLYRGSMKVVSVS